MLPSIVNVAGEREREARSARANVLEALWLACGVLILLWPLAFGAGMLGGWDLADTAAKWGLGVAMFWMLIGSPFWHRDTAESLGFGNPVRLWQLIKGRQGWSRWRLALLVLGIFTGLVALSVANWPYVARFFRFPAEVRAWPQEPAHWFAMSGFSVVVAALVSTCAIRYDNLGPSLRLAAIVCGGLLTYAGTAAWLHRGEAAFVRFNLQRLPLDVIGYAFWGFVQQIAFTAYFGARLRKGFGPAVERLDCGPDVERRDRVWMGGVTAALTLAPAVWLMVRVVHGSQVSLLLLPVMMIFAFPVGALWMHFYRLNKWRILVATLIGSFFGLIHADSYGLVLVTAGLGTIFAYAAMEDRLRNLAAFALVHGFMGSTFHKLFRDGGILSVNYRVGPWSIREPSAEVLVIPVLCLCGYALLAVWAARYLRRLPKAEAPAVTTVLPAHNTILQ